MGVSRSGTTLTRRILDRHSRIGIATENHYLGHLLAWEGARHYFRRLGDLHDDATVRRMVDLIYSPEFQRRSRLRELSPYWRWLTERVPRADIEARLPASDRTERGIFEAFLRIYADRRGKAIMGEKTPAHLAYVETLLEWFPDARVVHCMRDPRAIYVSELNQLLLLVGHDEVVPRAASCERRSSIGVLQQREKSAAGAHERYLRGCGRDAQDLGHIAHAKVGVVVEDDGRPLAGRQAGQRLGQ